MDHHVHDKFAKTVFSNRAIFIDLVQQLCPPGIAELIDYDTVQLIDNGHVDDKLAEHFSDLNYECRLLDGRPAVILFLMENKTNVPKHPHVQLMRYQLGRWEKAVVGKAKKLPLVLPILLYHGQRKWPNRPFSSSFDKLPESFEPFLPRLNYILLDLSMFNDRQLLGLGLLLRQILPLTNRRRQIPFLCFGYTQKPRLKSSQ